MSNQGYFILTTDSAEARRLLEELGFKVMSLNEGTHVLGHIEEDIDGHFYEISNVMFDTLPEFTAFDDEGTDPNNPATLKEIAETFIR